MLKEVSKIEENSLIGNEPCTVEDVKEKEPEREKRDINICHFKNIYMYEGLEGCDCGSDWISTENIRKIVHIRRDSS